MNNIRTIKGGINLKGKVKVAVMIFGRSTPVELDFNQIERA